MYSKYFNLKENPFSETPNTKYFFDAKTHLDALEQLNWIIESGKSFALLTGEVGTGKTLLCRMLLNTLPDYVQSALILCPKFNEMELIEMICDEFHLDRSWGDFSTFKDHLDLLNEFLIQSAHEGKKTVLIIDEAQLLNNETLETVRLLSNLETESQKLLQVILVAQPELRDRLKTHELRQVAQRVSIHIQVKSLNFKEMEKYITFRLEKSGDCNLIRFETKTLKYIYKHSKGLPRLINRFCEILLLAAEQFEIRLVEKKFARQIIESDQPLSTIGLLSKGRHL